MELRMRGTIKGKRIELEQETGLPAGSIVTVNIQSKQLRLGEKRRRVSALCGAWSGDASIQPIFSEIERQRGMTLPREASFDVAS